MPNKPFKRHVVIDTNILISAVILPHSILRQVIEKAKDEYILCASHETMNEFVEVINRPKFLKYFANPDDRQQFITLVERASQIIEVIHEVTDCTDPKDNKFLSLALSANAIYLVTGDKKDLLAMNPYHGVEIITARAFLDKPTP
ncbi:putative toxin-antitoxin system toxin component, PIN family [Alysiella filiformis]|uniref:Putative toxin-antitoxin system toxin component, PIN family n=1 Tax=Alysiella filiformis DSM 16848 TaxID=1120981 RepID=A0A286E9X5_9NEIS|nr:putative toxin-antitoxin system toxin component, PIN family [Alysiella filiformis]QMT31385.1 putative toxin-antitoxin system toxin component, PIN family [Alysiella filiformis]UBQ55606.1 putative toxin-antitoxin system toxin component, PIN family [Alysiella filiformis DSM 16848]SOD67634.1 putative toxin-antitoxin system toxin component, PIN family [Alysiella filiformis DSM 16848]